MEIKNIFTMDCGSPSPMIISNDSDLFIAFYADEKMDVANSREHGTAYEVAVVLLKFRSFLKYSFGAPSNETIRAHPYYNLGLKSYGFYELNDSDLIKELNAIDSIHPYYDADSWRSYKHYILTFHDNMFECVARGYEVKEEKNISMYNLAISSLNEFNLDN